MIMNTGTYKYLADLAIQLNAAPESRRKLAKVFANELFGDRSGCDRLRMRTSRVHLVKLIHGTLDGSLAESIFSTIERNLAENDNSADHVKEALLLWRNISDAVGYDVCLYDTLSSLRLPRGMNLYGLNSFNSAAVACLRNSKDLKPEVDRCLSEVLDHVLTDADLFAHWVSTYRQFGDSDQSSHPETHSALKVSTFGPVKPALCWRWRLIRSLVVAALIAVFIALAVGIIGRIGLTGKTSTTTISPKKQGQQPKIVASQSYHSDLIRISTTVVSLSMAAEQGEAVAQTRLGYCYEHGKGVTQDATEAVKWYRKAADQGNATAQNNLGMCYEHGKGVTRDAIEAVKWYRKAADQGNATAQYNLGHCYQYSKGVTQDATEAVKWYQNAADQAFSSAQNNLGYCYMHGKGLTQDATEAVKWYRKAANQKNATAQYNLGHCYEYGKGVNQDMLKAVKLYREAARSGNETAKKVLGLLGKN